MLYIGAYIPAIANHIVQYNTDLHYRRVYSPEGLNKNEKLANLKGIAIGNGVIDMITQVYYSIILLYLTPPVIILTLICVYMDRRKRIANMRIHMA